MKNKMILFGINAMLTLIPCVHTEAIIIDHNCTNLSQIPDYWIEQAKNLTIHYAHTSHGSQITSGIEKLETQDSNYSFARRAGTSDGLPPIEDQPALRMYDGNPQETYITPEDYWDNLTASNALDRTRAVADTGNYNFSMWSWCGQQSSNSETTTLRYIDNMNTLESEYPDMRFIYMTGHTDGTGENGHLNLRNNQVRDYCIANDKILFDFADIESYDPDGNYYLDRGVNDNCDYDGGGNWADEWCTANPGSDLCAVCSCSHSKKLNCNLKGRAFWWMMARLAGWSGGLECLGTCCTDTSCTDSFATNVNCSSCTAAGKYWQPNKDAACFDCDAPSDLCLSYCPQCCNGADDDGDGATDYPADKQCTCGLDPSEAEPLLPIPEASSIVLVGIGLLGLILLMRWQREE